jgi:hypothetical protein
LSEGPDASLIEQYHAALQSLIFEGQAFWTRITAFVLLNSALLVARSALPQGPGDHWIRISVAVLGSASALLWGHSAVRAHYIRTYWLTVLRDLEQRLDMGPSGPFTGRERFLAGGHSRLPGGEELQLPRLARGNVDDSTGLILTLVFLAIWVTALVRLS